MKKFEYITVAFATMPTETRLNQYGNEGWQIVNVRAVEGSSIVNITFMREKE